jgi:hypothetical protein
VRAGQHDAEITEAHRIVYAALAEQTQHQIAALKEILTALRKEGGVVSWGAHFDTFAKSSVSAGRLRLLLGTGGHQPTDVDAEAFSQATGASAAVAQELLAYYPALSNPNTKDRRAPASLRKELLGILQPHDVAELHAEQGLDRGTDPKVPDILCASHVEIGEPSERYSDAGVPKHLYRYSSGDADFSGNHEAMRDARVILSSITQALGCKPQIDSFLDDNRAVSRRCILSACLAAWRTSGHAGALHLIAKRELSFESLCPYTQGKILDSMAGTELNARSLDNNQLLIEFKNLFISAGSKHHRSLRRMISVPTEAVGRGAHALRVLLPESRHKEALWDKAQSLSFRARCEALGKIGCAVAGPEDLLQLNHRTFIELVNLHATRFVNPQAEELIQKFARRLVSEYAELIGTIPDGSSSARLSIYQSLREPIHARLGRIAKSETSSGHLEFQRALHTMVKLPAIFDTKPGRALCERAKRTLQVMSDDEIVRNGFNEKSVVSSICQALIRSNDQENIKAVAELFCRIPTKVAANSTHLHQMFFEVYDSLSEPTRAATLIHCWKAAVEAGQPVQRVWASFLQSRSLHEILPVITPDTTAVIKLLGGSFAEPQLQKLVLDTIDKQRIVEALELVRDKDPGALQASLQHERVGESLELLARRCQLLVKGRSAYDEARISCGDFLVHRALPETKLPNHFAILGVPVSAVAETVAESLAAIKSCFHPDLVTDEGLKAKYTKIVQEAAVSAEVLTNPSKRTAYLAQLRFLQHQKGRDRHYAPLSPWFGRLMADELWKRKVAPGSLSNRSSDSSSPALTRQVLQLGSGS